ncbi:ATP-binding mismatch repair protein [Coemansia sp. RSA 1843]|nr:ATP-binding mismatch repair protein [Coemansia sp. RSA 1843]
MVEVAAEQTANAEPSTNGVVAAAMKPIAKDTVHRLCSGQVIVDLATAVKELLENSLDAGATHVDIKMKDSGLASITITDNGHGIREIDHETLCRKHWTSKISSFEDLESVSTFGFRGEALSSLCAVSTITVTTATSDSAPMGIQLEYDSSGELVTQSPVARERGTTVQLTGLFAKWPVRLQDLKKNIRREYIRTVALIEQYAIICDTVRLTLTNKSARGASVVSVRTPPGQCDRLTRLAMVLGSQMRPHLVHFNHELPPEDDEHSSGLDLRIDGHISKPLPEAGRSASDKQYFFVNGRPCDFAKAKKVVNEMYRAYCPTRYPVFAIAISINAATVDVNLTPDKRTLLIRHEPQLLAALRDALAEVVEPKESVYAVNKVQTQLTPMPDNHVVVCPSTVPGVSRCFVEPGDGAEEVSGGAKRLSADPDDADVSVAPESKRLNAEQQNHRMEPVVSNALSEAKAAPNTQCYSPDAKESESSRNVRNLSESHKQQSKRPTAAAAAAAKTVVPPKRLPTCVVDMCKNRIQTDNHDWARVRLRMQEKISRTAQMREESQQRHIQEGLDSAAVRDGGIANANPEEASCALSRLIHKSDFSQMQVLGQFNHGFIVARLDLDLYIIDQHASDEKYNFEILQQRAVISAQPLIRPSQLELSVIDEGVAMEHKDTLMRNGFHVRIDEDQEPGRRVSLLSQPFIDQMLFDQSDLLELIGKLCVNPESMPRCERARKMFASRACRKSTMIGDPLGMAQMKAIVHHLSTLDHPWNCPHGRPTMRHLHRLLS